MILFPEIESSRTLDDYASFAHLAHAVQELRGEAALLEKSLRGRRVWMVNSTPRGGGVAEMMPMLVSMLRELGIDTTWAVISTDRTEFFTLTKRLHNLIHGAGEPLFDGEARELYQTVSRENADELAPKIDPNDILVIHDPQPLGCGALLKEKFGIPAIWRCHIGVEEHTPQTRSAWRFMEPYATAYDHAVFTASEYIPDYLTGHTTLISPAIDPLSHKNRDLSPHKLMGVLCNSGLARTHQDVVTPPFEDRAQRLRSDGRFGPAAEAREVGFLYRPLVAQVSRWDRLKGYGPLLEGFVRLKREALAEGFAGDVRERRRLELLQLVLAGPDPSSIQDDPEAVEVLEEMCHHYAEIEPRVQRDIAIISLPMISRKENALMVNAIQRCSLVVVQNSLREGFGLTATEAMWKHVPVLGTRAVGLRLQIREGVDGFLVRDPEQPDEISSALRRMLEDPNDREMWGRSAQRRVYDQYLIFRQVAGWIRTLSRVVERREEAA